MTRAALIGILALLCSACGSLEIDAETPRQQLLRAELLYSALANQTADFFDAGILDPADESSGHIVQTFQVVNGLLDEASAMITRGDSTAQSKIIAAMRIINRLASDLAQAQKAAEAEA